MLRESLGVRPGLKLLPDLVNSPGPVYEVRKVPGKDTPSVGFGRAERFSSSYSMDLSYDSNHTTAKQRLSRPTFSPQQSPLSKASPSPAMKPTNPPHESIKSLSLRDDLPGPGSYNTSPPMYTRNTSFGIGERSSILNRSSDPLGPAAYNLKSDLLKKTGALITTRQPFKFPVNESPGPGAYSPSKLNLASHISFAKANRVPEKGRRTVRSSTLSPVSYAPSTSVMSMSKVTPRAERTTPKPRRQDTQSETLSSTKAYLMEQEQRLKALQQDLGINKS
jgi:hypothetical protein